MHNFFPRFAQPPTSLQLVPTLPLPDGPDAVAAVAVDHDYSPYPPEDSWFAWRLGLFQENPLLATPAVAGSSKFNNGVLEG